ncbi:hypothetical protein KSS87_009329 [Heliosperma pusillum]|nr:hypothetical protein KSS87_009329 [Heliosperma pusillum]
MVVKFTVDLNKPLVSQVGHLGEDYDEWVHQPIIRQIRFTIFFMVAITNTLRIHCASSSLQQQPQSFVYQLLSSPSVTPALFGGVLMGYVMYDITHYYLHHGQPSTGVSKKLKSYHLNHHYRLRTKGFGITSSFWDIVFGTKPPPKATEKRG